MSEATIDSMMGGLQRLKEVRQYPVPQFAAGI